MIPTHTVNGPRGPVFVGSLDGATDRAEMLNATYSTDEFKVVPL